MTHIRTLMDQMIQIDEGRMKDIFTADEEGQSAKEIAKALNLPLGTVKKILGEEEELKEFTASQLDILSKQYAGMSGKTISIDQANKLRKIFKQVPDSAMDALRKKKIPFLSGLALSRMVQKGMPVKEDKEEPKLEPGKDQDALEKQLVTAQGQINILKQKLENEKNKAVKPEPNKETGEVPLTVGIAHKYIKDKKEKDKEEVKKEVKEAFSVQVTKMDGGKFIHGTYKSKAEAEKWIKWYKTGDLRKTKKIEIVKEEYQNEDDINWAGKLEEARYRVSGTMGYKGIGGTDGFEMVINANSERDAENKAERELDKARSKRQIGPGGGGSIEDLEVEGAEKTNDPLESPSHFRLNHFDPSMKEGKAPYRLSYDDKYGKHAGFEDANSLADLQNKAQKLRAKGFKINKMGRNTSPVEQRLPEPEGKTEVSEIRIRPKSVVESDPTQYGPDKVAKAMKIAVKSDGMYSKAVREIEKIAKDLSKVSTIARALKTANENFIHPGKATFERIYKEVSDKLKLKVLDRKIKKAKDKFHKGLRRP